jgi:uncharacterized protein YbgA (DUF1722 family)/uncharacterized protein YbbK (DUF523 family)
MQQPLRLGVNSCLLGEKVRYDGQHKRDRFLTDVLGHYLEFVPVCPEVECGFGVPRESLRLVGDVERPRMVTSRTGVDVTDRMEGWARERVEQLESEDLCGFVFKSKSPSNGMERVRVYGPKGQPVRKGVGIFARIFMETFPLLPVEEEGRLRDAGLRERFIEAIFTMKRWRDACAGRRTRKGLVDFHTRHKLLLMSHSPKHLKEMGQLVAAAKEHPIPALYEQYEFVLLQAMRLKSTPGKQANVLSHAQGYFKRVLTADERQELKTLIGQYREGLVPLIVPITLINHYVRKYQEPYLQGQVWLEPHPLELKLRNHV